MRFAPMRFSGMSLRHNPEKLSISGRDHVRVYHSPCCDADRSCGGEKVKAHTGRNIAWRRRIWYHDMQKGVPLCRKNWFLGFLC